MKCISGTWWYQGKSYNTLRDALVPTGLSKANRRGPVIPVYRPPMGKSI